MTTEHEISASTIACWFCGFVRNGFEATVSVFDGSALLCPSCNKIQPPLGGDYFQVFAFPRQLSLDPKSLELRFHQLSRRLHPDRFARASAEEQQWSLAATALLNDAYRTLRDPLARIEYLLKLSGLKIGEENSGKGAMRQPPVDLLEEVFELNMQLEEMRMNQKMGEDDPSLQADLVAARGKFEALLAEVDADLTSQGALWDAGDGTARDKAANAMAALLDRRRYLRNLVRDVNEVLAA